MYEVVYDCRKAELKISVYFLKLYYCILICPVYQ